jgi:OmcA/MtrC family decaheme c-type cytochrome
MVHFRHSYFRLALVLLALPLVLLTAADRSPKTVTVGRLQASQLDQNQMGFLRPGIVVKILSAGVKSDGTISARVTVTDPAGLPLDKDGINPPGAVAMSFIAAYIPANQRQYVSYTTTVLKSTLNNNPSQIQAANDSGGTFTKNGDGDYTYTFKTKAPAGFDTTATHAIGVSARRDLSAFIKYDEWSEAANDVFTFVPNGAPVSTIRSVVTTDACNACHNPLIGHGGSRLKVELCIICHTPQTVNPDTGLTQDMPVLIHKIHMGSSLPSVVAGIPYRIWHRGAWSDFSNVVFPQDIRNCAACHTAAAKQADNWKTKPSRAVCGSCHDDVNFDTGENHVDYPVWDDNECQYCHRPTQTRELDASIPGAHLVPNNSAQLPGLILKVLSVENAVPGSSPTVTFSVLNKAGVPVDISKLARMRMLLYGPNVDYQTGPGAVNVSEDVGKTPISNGVFKYTMAAKLPAAAAGSYTISLEARNTMTLFPKTKEETVATEGALPVQYYFSVDKSKLVPRRVVVTTEKCAVCHKDLKFIHGGNRGGTQECVMCHNPSLVDGTSKQSVNFAWQIHSIHRGESLANPYILGTTNYQEIRFPGDLRVCTTCHVAGSYLPDNIGAVAAVASPGGFTPTAGPIAAACMGCHDDIVTAAHALINTSPIGGESCVVCHGQDDKFSVDNIHSR